jgi:hypothetical protein
MAAYFALRGAKPRFEQRRRRDTCQLALKFC